MSTVPQSVTEEAERTWAEQSDAKVYKATAEERVWVVARDGRVESFTGRYADEDADDLARRWARELGGSGKRSDELEMEREWREAGSKPEDEPRRWSVGFFQPRREPEPPPMPMPWEWPHRCEASLSADSYKRHTPRAEYDHEKWLWMDGGHERCQQRVTKLMPTRERWVGFCKRHDPGPGGQYFPYIPPGEGCSQPCCEGGER